MAMQPRAWMTSYLFSAWISHFIASIRRNGEISPDNRHLLILDGHSSHATLEVIQEARSSGLDILTLPSHTSHALQPLDVSVFKPFKQYFREYRDFWTSRNMQQPAGKETLAQWVSLALKKALSAGNIKAGFEGTGIWPLNATAVDGQLAPSRVFESRADDEGIVAESPLDGVAGEARLAGAADSQVTRIPNTEPWFTQLDQEREAGGADSEETRIPNTESVPIQAQVEQERDDDSEATESEGIETEMAAEPSSQAEHFFVDCDTADAGLAEEVAGLDPAIEEVESITRFLTLPTVTARSKPKFRDPILDFTTSHILTSEEFTKAMEAWKESRENAAKEKERKATEREETKKRKAAEKEEARLARVEAREEAARLKELRAAMRAEELAKKKAERQEARSRKVQQAAEAAAAKAAMAAEKARLANDIQEAHRMRMMGIAESAHGCQCRRGSVDILGCEVHGVRAYSSPPLHQRIPAFMTGSPSPFTASVSNTELPNRHLGTHLQSTLSSDPTTSRQRLHVVYHGQSGFAGGSNNAQLSHQ